MAETHACNYYTKSSILSQILVVVKNTQSKCFILLILKRSWKRSPWSELIGFHNVRYYIILRKVTVVLRTINTLKVVTIHQKINFTMLTFSWGSVYFALNDTIYYLLGIKSTHDGLCEALPLPFKPFLLQD